MTISSRASFAESRPYPSYQGVKLGPILEIVPQFVPGIPPPVSDDEEDGELAEHAESDYSRPPTPVGKSYKHVFDTALKDKVWVPAANFAETSTRLLSLRKAGTSRERIIILTLEAVMQQCKSADGMKSAVKHVASLIRFFLGKQSDEQVTLAGETSLVLLHDFLEQAASRGRTVPPTIRHSINGWAKALEIEWPLDHPLIFSAVSVESTTAPKHAPAMPLETAKLLEGVATNKEVTPFKLAFADGILLM